MDRGMFVTYIILAMKKILISLLAVFLFLNTTAQIGVYLTIEPPTSSSNCDGWVMAYVETGQSPYTYVWNDTLSTSGDPFLLEYDTLWNLCPGIYTLDIYDSAGDSLHLDFFLTSNDLTFGSGGGATDTIEYSVEDCTLDYSITVDTAYLSSATILNVFPGASADSIAMQWTIVQQSITTIVSDTIIGHFPVGSDFVLEAGVFCPDSAFRTQVKVIQIFGLIDQNVGIKNNKKRVFSFYPNPFHDILYFKGLIEFDNVNIYDIGGRLIYSQTIKNSENSILLPNLDAGVYLLKLSTKHGFEIIRIVKE